MQRVRNEFMSSIRSRRRLFCLFNTEFHEVKWTCLLSNATQPVCTAMLHFRPPPAWRGVNQYRLMRCCSEFALGWWSGSNVGDSAWSSRDPDEGARWRAALAGASDATTDSQDETPHKDPLRWRQPKVRRNIHVQSSTRSVFYLRQKRGICFARVVCLSVCLWARLLKKACMDLDEMLRVDRCRDMDELINFWARSGL